MVPTTVYFATAKTNPFNGNCHNWIAFSPQPLDPSHEDFFLWHMRFLKKKQTYNTRCVLFHVANINELSHTKIFSKPDTSKHRRNYTPWFI